MSVNEKFADKFDLRLYALITEAQHRLDTCDLRFGEKWSHIRRTLAELRPTVRSMMNDKDRKDTEG